MLAVVPICWHDRELCCLLAAWARNVGEMVPQLVKSPDYNSLLLFCVGKSDTASWLEARWNLGGFKEHHKTLEVPEKGIGA